jgi:hypothetical protein
MLPWHPDESAPVMTKHPRSPSMKVAVPTVYATRDSVLKMLSEPELEKVHSAEPTARMPVGDEYLDLMRLAQGVQRARGAVMDMSHLLPKDTVEESTWSKILLHLAASGGAPAPASK